MYFEVLDLKLKEIKESIRFWVFSGLKLFTLDSGNFWGTLQMATKCDENMLQNNHRHGFLKLVTWRQTD